ncbi:MAG: polysaccharide biosynthesis/export family protein, partial [Myxococcota bacterium]|nr:polysaccharide biosynthesis/export family protein [Myxococcota bacterium]
MKRSVHLFVGLVATASACSTLRLGSADIDPLPTQTANETTSLIGNYPLGTGDVIDIKVFREPELAGVYRLSSNGEISFPFIGAVRVDGKTAYELGEEIRIRLASGYLNNPQVTVFVREYHSQKVHILGQVAKAGTQGFQPGMTIIQAVATAGGFTKLASTNRVRVTRVVKGNEKKYLIPVGDIRNGNAPDFSLLPGD